MLKDFTGFRERLIDRTVATGQPMGWPGFLSETRFVFYLQQYEKLFCNLPQILCIFLKSASFFEGSSKTMWTIEGD